MESHFHVGGEHPARSPAKVSVDCGEDISGDEIVLFACARHRINLPGHKFMPKLGESLTLEIFVGGNELGSQGRFHQSILVTESIGSQARGSGFPASSP